MVSRAKEGGIGDGKIGVLLDGLRGQDSLERLFIIGSQYVLAYIVQPPGSKGRFLRHIGDVGQGGQTAHVGQHGGTVGGGQLSAIGGVSLIAVILRRVVGGCDGDARGTIQVPDGVGEDGHRGDLGKQIYGNPVAAEDQSGLPGKILGAVAGVTGDNHSLNGLAVLQEHPA